MKSSSKTFLAFMKPFNRMYSLCTHMHFLSILNTHNIYLFKLILKADFWSTRHTGVVTQFTRCNAILRVTTLWAIPCQINRSFPLTLSDFFDIWKTCSNCLETNIHQFLYLGQASSEIMAYNAFFFRSNPNLKCL